MTELKPPIVENAPGLKWQRRKGGWTAIWRARRDLVKKGFEPKNRIVIAVLENETPSDVETKFIQDICNSLQTEMLVFGRGGVPALAEFDGTIKGLIYWFQHDPDSFYHKKRYVTRGYYDRLCSRLERDCGNVLIGEFRARELLRFHEQWSANGKIAMGHSLVGMLRTLCAFGSTILNNGDCRSFKALLHDMRFPMAKARESTLSFEQANAIRGDAHARGRHSIALAQAFQFDCTLRQKDVIGEFVPMDEPGIGLPFGQMKWMRGLRWEEIDENLILRHITSKKQKEIQVDLTLCPMVMEELKRLSAPLPKSGPIVVSEITGEPYQADSYRRDWRKSAKAVGVPKGVWNMDTRAGAITEATDAGASLEQARHAATHSNIAMTQRYSRGSEQKVAEVLKLRAAHRIKNEQ